MAPIPAIGPRLPPVHGAVPQGQASPRRAVGPPRPRELGAELGVDASTRRDRVVTEIEDDALLEEPQPVQVDVEAERGEVVSVTSIRQQVPVEEYLRLQKRFAHLFGANPRPDIVERIQAGADHNIERFGLLAGEGEGAELPGA